MGVQGVSWWGMVPSAASPVLLAGGWTAAAGLQPQSYDPVADTVSALAALGATDRWVMTIAFVAASICEFVTALARAPGADAGPTDPHGRRGRGRAGRGQPRGCGGPVTAARDLRDSQSRCAGGMAGSCLAARAGGAVGFAPRRGRVGCWRPSRVACRVRRGVGDRGRAGRASRARARPRPGGLAFRRRRVLPPSEDRGDFQRGYVRLKAVLSGVARSLLRGLG